MHELVVVTGPPGAGKSTVAASLVELFDPSALIEGDAFFGFLRNGAVAPWTPEAHQQNTVVTQAAAAATGRLVEHCPVVFDGVVGPWFVTTFLEATGLRHLHYVVLLPPLAVCLARVASRRGHGFTDRDAAEHMWHEFQDTALARRHFVEETDGDTHPADVARALRHGLRAGTFRYP